ncbi:cytochrome b5 domain-containing protein [Monocercomonoides exilis]|uniref:cytochrome b5 domain-containing protein n=1 Tax=Monocercomonoides exilis TaxID=2049356 RepID=UPI003559BBA6|nr:cytochrome b5 domain-containing protein [Monocercomonoides exilis]|eukprot:MONOS_3478.1-p1 / transcript=MONOS_3478.1 / gene=MONOS_3478 / organism=Monocercomonoides_exilis_PA203 / gene_product=cytochrome b5 domain-containing protein / transcript_product=cytochrome b5 domain-containing protein / location=Mono_scaffold00082:88715-89426(-) / protein_length=173 / sequence_SO=supercontig / SO=protein_coding / is_pseudo=false
MIKSTLPEISFEEVSKHSTDSDLWVIVKGIVLDVTNFKHRAGRAPLLKSGGKDITESFNRYHAYVNCAFLPGVKVVGKLQGAVTSQSTSSFSSSLFGMPIIGSEPAPSMPSARASSFPHQPSVFQPISPQPSSTEANTKMSNFSSLSKVDEKPKEESTTKPSIISPTDLTSS